ncbi:MAG TPA: hypothetical protein VML55_19475, partial [Planctomycetaceae bacterium]|nr:hypothetical protein [Planctomycetaceae bacterium]
MPALESLAPAAPGQTSGVEALFADGDDSGPSNGDVSAAPDFVFPASTAAPDDVVLASAGVAALSAHAANQVFTDSGLLGEILDSLPIGPGVGLGVGTDFEPLVEAGSPVSALPV